MALYLTPSSLIKTYFVYLCENQGLETINLNHIGGAYEKLYSKKVFVLVNISTSISIIKIIKMSLKYVGVLMKNVVIQSKKLLMLLIKILIAGLVILIVPMVFLWLLVCLIDVHVGEQEMVGQ